MNVELVRENADGSAVYTFDMTQDQMESLLRYGIVTAIKNGIEEAKRYHPDYIAKEETLLYDSIFNTAIRAAQDVLMEEHDKVCDVHNYYRVAADILEDLLYKEKP